LRWLFLSKDHVPRVVTAGAVLPPIRAKRKASPKFEHTNFWAAFCFPFIVRFISVT
jgi:hypothetical protein